MHTCILSHRLKRSWHSCPRRVHAGNKNTPSMHNEDGMRLPQWLDRKKTVTYAKVSPKVVNTRDTAGNAEEDFHHHHYDPHCHMSVLSSLFSSQWCISVWQGPPPMPAACLRWTGNSSGRWEVTTPACRSGEGKTMSWPSRYVAESSSLPVCPHTFVFFAKWGKGMGVERMKEREREREREREIVGERAKERVYVCGWERGGCWCDLTGGLIYLQKG